jgi:hypothetical protein
MYPSGVPLSICGLLFQWASTIKIQLSMLVYHKADLFSQWCSQGQGCGNTEMLCLSMGKLSEKSYTSTHNPICPVSFKTFDKPTSLLFLLNAAFLAEKLQIPILYSLVWPDLGLNPRSAALEVRMLTITPLMQLIIDRYQRCVYMYEY